MRESKVDDTLDITSLTCPVTFARTLLKLEEMNVGEVLEVFLKGEEPVQNAPKSIEKEGHRVLLLEKAGDIFRMLVLRGE